MSEASEPDVHLEIALRETLAPHRPEPDAFERRVRERIRERERVPRVEPREPSRFVRWAASILPPDIGLALLAKQGGFLSTLALPVLVVASGFGAFVASKRSIERSAREAVPPTAPEPKQAWTDAPLASQRFSGPLRLLLQFSFLPLLVPVLVLGGARAYDFVALFLLVSMGLITWQIRAMSRAGLMRRGSVARMCCGLLASVYMVCFLWNGSFHIVDPGSAIGPNKSAFLVLVAIAACAFVMWRERAVHGGVAVLVFGWCAFVLAAQTPLASPSSAAYLRRFLSGFEADTRALMRWSVVGNAAEALAAVGEPLPDCSRVRTSLERAIDTGDDAHPQMWTTGARLGLVDTVHWSRLSERPREKHALAQLLELDAPLNTTSYYEYQFHMLLATHALDAAQREHLAERIEKSWPREPKHGRLEIALTCVRLWALLGQQARIDAHRDDIRALLVEHWIPGSERGFAARLGGFTSNPQEFRTSFDDTTYAAVALMARVGIPEGIDAFLLRGHLRAESERFSSWIEGSRFVQCDSHAAWLRLEREIGLPKRTWLERVLAERVFVATLLTLALCVVALRAAPSRAELARRGMA